MKRIPTAKALSRFVKRGHTAIRDWIQKYPKKISSKRKKISEYIIDETLIKVGSEYIGLWVAIEPKNMEILAPIISKRNMFVADRFLANIVKSYREHLVSTDQGTWYPMACKFLNLNHHIHSSIEKSLIERTMHYIKDRTESFDDYFPCRIKNCKIKDVKILLRFFVDYHNMGIKPVKRTEPLFFFNYILLHESI